MNFLTSLVKYIMLSSPYLLFGFLASGIIRVLLTNKQVQNTLGKNNFSSILKASLIGIPLPLCSCAVIPTAVTIRKSGAGTGATSSFLISTPESGVDSISVTYALMDLPMTIIRPIAAFVSAFFAGTLQYLFNNVDYVEEVEQQKTCCKKNKNEAANNKSIGEFISRVFNFSFIEIMDDIAIWLTVGIIAGAGIDYLVPPNLFSEFNGIMAKLVIVVAAVPMYICASATTPMAASLVLKGMAPGTALILLLLGPATNISNLLILQKYIGKKGIILNLVAIVIVTLIFSFSVDYLYFYFNLPIDFTIGHDEHLHEHGYSLVQKISSLIFVLLLLRSLIVGKLLPILLKK